MSDRVDGKSIMDLLTLGATQGTELMIEAEGDDAARGGRGLGGARGERFPRTKTHETTNQRQGK